MTNQHDDSSDNKLDKTTLNLLAEAQQPVDVPADRVARMRKKLLQDIKPSLPLDYITIRADEGEWEEIAPKIYKKVLHLDTKTGNESYLLRAEPGAVAPAHDHDHDELCFVLEGEIEFDHVSLKAGDYHFAPKGSQHSDARTHTGAVVLMQQV